jgi:hypothetical protein
MHDSITLESLFFPVKLRPLQTSIDDELVKVPRYRVVSCPTGVLGVKPSWQPTAESRPPALGRHLVFDHQQADVLSRDLYSQVFGTTAQPQQWVGAPPTGEKGPVGAWAAVVYGHAEYTVADAMRSTQFRQHRPASLPVAEWEPAFWQGYEPFAQELAHFQPALAFTNGFDYDDELLFYVLVTLPETAEPARIWERGEPATRHRPQRPVLVLKAGRFRVGHVEQLHHLTGAELLARARQLVPEIASSFRQELQDFANHYYLLSRTYVPAEALMPVMLDLYNTNRNVRSIALDAGLRSSIRRRVHAARGFFAQQQNDLASLVRFLMYEDAFDPARFDRRAAEEVLTQRDAYRNLRKRLSHRTLEHSKRLGDYLESQVVDYEALAHQL